MKQQSEDENCKADEDDPDKPKEPCMTCGQMKVTLRENILQDGQELIQIQNKYSSIIQQKQTKLESLEDQLIKCQNQLDDTKDENHRV